MTTMPWRSAISPWKKSSLTFFHVKNLRFSRVLRTRDCLVQSDRQFIHGRYQPVEKVIPDLFPREKPPVFSSATHSRPARAASDRQFIHGLLRSGAWREKTLSGKTSLGIVRSTFVIDAGGTVARVFRSVKAEGHAEQVLKALDALA